MNLLLSTILSYGFQGPPVPEVTVADNLLSSEVLDIFS